MGKIRIVTDSSAQFLDPSVVRRYGITILPHTIALGGQLFRENVDLDSAACFRLLNEAPPGTLPVLNPPGVPQFSEAYTALHRETDRILSIHVSRGLSRAWEHAQEATRTLLGRCSFSIIDSMTTSVGLGLLVEDAARLTEKVDALEALARALRKRVTHLYGVFQTDAFAYLERGGLLSVSQSMLGDMLGIKPFVTIEDGVLVTMEKVRTRAQTLEKLIEFAAEFEPTDRLVIVHGFPAPTELIRQIQERLVSELNRLACPAVTYQPSLATFIGPEAVGMMVYQSSDSLE